MLAWAEVCHLLQSSKSSLTGFLCSIGWRIIDQTRLSSNTRRTPTVLLLQQPCINNYISLLSDLCACVHLKKNGVEKEAIYSSSVSGSSRLMWLQTWKKVMGWCENHRERVMQIWTSPCEEEEEEEEERKKEKHFGRLATFSTFAMLFKAVTTPYHSSSSVFMTNNMPSGTIS